MQVCYQKTANRPLLPYKPGSFDCYACTSGRERDRAVRELERLKVQLAAADERAARSERRLERQWVVHEDDVTLCQELGRGSFGTVHLARWQGSNIAVKTVAPHALPEEKAKAAKQLVNETRALKRVRHANVILMLGACAEPPMLLMQLAPGGRTLRRELDEESPSVARRFHLIRGVCAGMAALHRAGVLHLDIKPTNVLIGGDGAPLLADFGLSIQLSMTLSSVAASTPAGGGRGTFQYTAPELFAEEVKYAKPADVYSFAMLVWETVTGIVPWTGPTEADKMTDKQITAAHIKASMGHPAKRPTLPSGDACPPAIGKLISVCWAQDPAKRPTFDAALAQLDSVASDFPTDDAGRLAGKAAAVVDDLERRLKAAEAERADLEHLAAHGRAEMDEASRAVDALKAERDAAVRDRDALAGALRAATVTFPQTWTEQADDGGDRSDIGWWRLGRQLVDIDARTNGAEWKDVAERLSASLPGARLVQLERWENRLLWRDYWTKREHLQVKRSGDANERWLWHGTGRTPPATVLEHEVGPDPRFSKGGFYGPGLYLAEKARYSNDDRYVHQVPGGTLGCHRSHRQLLLCRAALGLSFDFGDDVRKDLKKPPEESAGVLYDSVRGGPHQPRTAGAGDNDSPIFVLYDLAQAYPEYVVTYELE